MEEKNAEQYMATEDVDKREQAAKKWAHYRRDLEFAQGRLARAKDRAREAHDEALELALTVGRLEVAARDSESALRQLM